MFYLIIKKWRKLLHIAAYLTTLLINAGVSIPAVTLAPGTGDEPPSACYPDDLSKDLDTDYTVCAFVKPSVRGQTASIGNEDEFHEASEKDNFDGVLFTTFFNETYTETSIVDSRLTVFTNEIRYIFDAEFESDVWRKICITFESEKVTARVGDKEIRIITEESSNATEEFSGSFCLGAADDTSLNSFSGTVAALFLNIAGVEENGVNTYLTDCSNLIPSDNFLAFDSSWRRNGNSTYFDFPAVSLCIEAFTLITIKRFEGQKPHMAMCNSINGRFLTKGELSDGLFQTRIENIAQSCNLVNNNQFWIEGNITGVGLRTLCATGAADGTASMMPCITELHCSVCVLPTKLPFTLYGKVFTIDRWFKLINLDDGDFYLKGKDASEIRHNGSNWVMQSNLHNHEWHLKHTAFPTGRNIWYSEDKEISLTVTQCSQGQYSCNSSDCISIMNRCDGYDHCEDGSDEEDCKVIGLGKAYDKAKDPGMESTNTNYMKYYAYIHAVSNIHVIDSIAKIDINIDLKWRDPRLKFSNLKKDHVHYFLCDMIWNPRVESMSSDGYAAEQKLLSSRCDLDSIETDVQQDLYDHRMGNYLDGSKLSIIKETNYLVEFPCHFQLHRYPFGKHECNVTFFIRNDYSGMFFQAMEDMGPDDEIEFIGKDDLKDFKLEKITHSIDKDYLTITLHLLILFEYHLLSSFAPSALMFLICLSTFFFDINDFNERIMVSLTSLLVLAALFTQASSSSVKTPYYKLLDVWYAALIILCFIAVMMITFINNSRKVKSTPLRMKVTPLGGMWCTEKKRFLGCHNKTEYYNRLCIIFLSTLFIILIFAYGMLAANII